MSQSSPQNFITVFFDFLISQFRRSPKLTVASFFILVMLAIIVPLYQMIPDIVEGASLQDAELYSQAIREFRTLYTSEVIKRVKEHGSMRVSHDYQNSKDTIPLPATLSMLIGENIGKKGKGGKTKLYSAYPFPWRSETGGLQDDFSKQAWIHLNTYPEKPFFRIEEQNGERVLRYATADRMRASCVRCHNTHEDTPKKNWKIGDVRGILEITRPITPVVAKTESHLTKVVLIATLILLFVFFILSAILMRFQKATLDLESKKNDLELQKKELEKLNHLLEKGHKEVKEKSESLEKASQYKTEFLANMSHELRTPLNSIVVLSKILADNYDDYLHQDDIESAEAIHLASKDLLNLINDILDLSKVEAGQLKLISESVDIKILSEKLTQMFSPLAKEKGLDFVVETISDCPASLISDGMRIEQIVRNFLSNAFKFTTKGRVMLRFERTVENNSVWLQIAVSDTGPGIPEEKQSLIFEAFQQVDGSITRKFGGTGLGLTIARDMSELLGGQIRIKSQEGRGSTFSLYLPIHSDSSGVAEAAASTAPTLKEASPPEEQALTSKMSINLQSKKILLVDDNPKNIFSMKKLLSRYQPEILEANTGLEAIKQFKAHPDIAIILMDIMMPEMNGLEATQEIRKESPDIPIIALTAKVMPGDRDACLAAGVSDYLSKPVDVDELLRILSEYFS